jgi:hypothetical protein
LVDHNIVKDVVDKLNLAIGRIDKLESRLVSIEAELKLIRIKMKD